MPAPAPSRGGPWRQPPQGRRWRSAETFLLCLSSDRFDLTGCDRGQYATSIVASRSRYVVAKAATATWPFRAVCGGAFHEPQQDAVASHSGRERNWHQL